MYKFQCNAVQFFLITDMLSANYKKVIILYPIHTKP